MKITQIHKLLSSLGRKKAVYITSLSVVVLLLVISVIGILTNRFRPFASEDENVASLTESARDIPIPPAVVTSIDATGQSVRATSNSLTLTLVLPSPTPTPTVTPSPTCLPESCPSPTPTCESLDVTYSIYGLDRSSDFPISPVFRTGTVSLFSTTGERLSEATNWTAVPSPINPRVGLVSFSDCSTPFMQALRGATVPVKISWKPNGGLAEHSDPISLPLAVRSIAIDRLTPGDVGPKDNKITQEGDVVRMIEEVNKSSGDQDARNFDLNGNGQVGPEDLAVMSPHTHKIGKDH